MEFINPILLWGGLAISIPIIIHFWHKKRGKLMEWAAMQWLSEKTKQQARGLKLENILLLVLRILSILLLVLLLSKPLLKPFFNSKNATKVHWVLPKKEVVDNFKFELEEALKKGEKIFWLSGKSATHYVDIPSISKLNIQQGINKIAEQLKGGEQAEIYLSNEVDMFNKTYVPIPYQLHVLETKGLVTNPPYYKIDALNNLSINDKGELYVSQDTFNDKPLGSAPIKVLVEIGSEPIYAALKAIEDIYQLKFEIDSTRNKVYDIVFTTNSPKTEDKLTFVLNNKPVLEVNKIHSSKVVYLNEDLATSEIIENGRLPEIILEKWASIVGLKNNSNPLSINQVKQKFELLEKKNTTNTKWISNILLIILLIVIGAERWIALHKNV